MTQDTPSKTHKSGAPWRNFYGRFRGKSLRQSQQNYLESDLEGVTLKNVTWEDNPERSPLPLEQIFVGKQEIWLEIGFGGGEHLVHMAKSNPNIGLIGCEPYLNGVAMLLGKISDAHINNLMIHPGDARDLFDVLAPSSISKVFLNYPDPWPKKRHHRRRFVTPEHLEPLARVMAPNSELRVATDIKDYVRQTLEEVPKAGFEWTAEGADDWRVAWPDWLSTRYEQKAFREGRSAHYLTFTRNP